MMGSIRSVYILPLALALSANGAAAETSREKAPKSETHFVQDTPVNYDDPNMAMTSGYVNESSQACAGLFGHDLQKCLKRTGIIDEDTSVVAMRGQAPATREESGATADSQKRRSTR